MQAVLESFQYGLHGMLTDGMLTERLLILSLLSQGKKKMCIAKDRIHIFFCCLKEHSLKTE